MKNQYIFIILGVMLLLNMVLIVALLSSKKKTRSSGLEKEPVHLFNDTSREDKTQLSSSESKGRINNVPNKNKTEEQEINLKAIPNLSDQDKTAIRSDLVKKKDNKDETVILGKTISEDDPKTSVKAENKVYGRVYYKENGEDKEFIIKTNLINIGRDPNCCELVINDDKFLGRNHGIIYCKNDEMYYVDLNSKNGSFLEEKELKGQIQIQDNMKVKVAQTEITIKVGA